MSSEKMIKIIVALVVAAGFAALVARLRSTEEDGNRGEIERWVRDALEGALSRKLRESGEALRRALQGTPEPRLAHAVEDAVSSVNLEFSRKSAGRNVEICLNLLYKDGTSFSARSEWEWDRIPEPVRGEFLRGGKKLVRRPWSFPWEAAAG